MIKYQMLQGDVPCDVAIGYNETNLEIAKKEAINSEYTIVEVNVEQDSLQ